MGNGYSRGRGRGLDDRSEGWGGRGRSEQRGYEEERWRRNQEWSPSQDTSYQTGSSSSDSPYGYGASGMEDYGSEYNDYPRGGGQGDFRSFQGGNQFGYGSSGQGSYGQYGSGEFNRREARQSRFGGYGSQHRFSGQGEQEFGATEQGRFGSSQGNYGDARDQQYRTAGDRDFGPQSSYRSRFGSESGRYDKPGPQQSGFRGRGPKGYTRSDQRIEEDVNERLYDDYYLDASDIQVSVQGGTVTLSGEAEDREAKRRAEDIVESCSGVQQVQNNIKVKSSFTNWLFGDGSDEAENQRTSSSTSSTQGSSTGGSASRKATSSGS